MFVLDLSGSVGKDNYEKNMRPFILDVQGKFNIGPTAAQIALVTFASKGYYHWGLSKYQTHADLVANTNALPYPGASVLLYYFIL